MEVRKDHDEDKQVVHRERLFNNVSCKELQRLGLPQIQVDAGTEDQCQRNPDHGLCEPLPERDFMILSVQPGINGQHDGYQQAVKTPHNQLL